MRRFLLLAPLLVAALLGIGPAPDRPQHRPTPTPAPTPEIEESEAPEPTPTPEPPVFLAAFESTQGEGGERIAVFADGALVRTTRWKARLVTKRLVLSHEEVEVLRHVLGEALASTDAGTRGEVLAHGSERVMKLEIAAAGEHPDRSWTFDDATSLPLAAARARGALEDLRARFEEGSGEKDWDPRAVAAGDRLRRRSDGRWFVVARDDTFERNLELQSEDGAFVLWLARDQIPKNFHDPALPSPDPAPDEQR